MSKKDEALKRAEDALKRVRTQDMELVQLSMIALAAIREALAEPDFWEGYVPEPDKRQQALDKMAENARELGLDYEHPTQYWRAYASDYERGVIDGMQKQMQSSVDRAVNAMAGQPAQQEPVAWICEGSSSDEKHAIDYWPEDVDDLPIGTQLYTSPPAQRTWVGLTDDEILYCVELENPKAIAKEVEAKLKEKNA